MKIERAERGFTLFEVLAAMAILGILYTTLVGSAMDGLVAEGIARRRMEASLLADRRLAEVELEIDAGTTPTIGEEESEVGDYRVVVEVEPFDLLLAEIADPGRAPAPLLADLSRDGSSPLRSIRVRVQWLEGLLEFEVIRNSFALDLANLDTSALEQQQQQPLDSGGSRSEP